MIVIPASYSSAIDSSQHSQNLFNKVYKKIYDIYNVAENMTKIIKNGTLNDKEQNNSRTSSSHEPAVSDINTSQSGKFKKFGNFTQIIHGTRLGFNDTTSSRTKNQTLKENENRSVKTSEFTP
jgi:hypothetical protein